MHAPNKIVSKNILYELIKLRENSKNKEDMNNLINKIYLRLLYSKLTDYAFFQVFLEYANIELMMNHKTILNKFFLI